jgi:hypothetical protein
MSEAHRTDGSWRRWIEAAFVRWGRFVVRHRWGALAASIVVTAGLMAQLPGLTIDNSTESFLLPDDPAVITYNAFRDQFGREDQIVVAVRTPDLFDRGFLERLRALHEAIEAEVPHVDEVESLLNARVTRGDETGLVVEELFEAWPESEAELARLRDLAYANPLYEGTLISKDRHVTAILVTPNTYSARSPKETELGGFADDVPSEDDAAPPPVYLSDVEGDAIVDALLGLADRFEAPDFELHLAGSLILTHRMNQSLIRDFGIFIPTALALMSIVLALLFRRIGGIVLPLLVVVLSVGATIGIMCLLGIPGSVVIQILPVFLLTVGLCDAVHILAIVYRLRMAGESREDAIAHAIGHSGLAVLMTSLTTALGMASFVTAEMASIAQLGVLAPIGVAMAFVYTLVLLPALLAIFPLPVPSRGGIARGHFPLEGFLVAAGRFAVRSPHRVLLPASLLVVLAVLGALQTRFSHNGLSWFPENDRVRRDFAVIDDALGGSVSLEVVVDTGERGGLYAPELLAELDRIGREIRYHAADPLVIGPETSILDVVRETHQALNEGRPGMRRIPDTREAVAQELLLFESSGSDDTEKLVDTECRTARLNLRVGFCDALVFPPFLEKVETILAARLGDRADYEVTGLISLLGRIFDQLIRSMLRSYAFALLVITPLMMLLLGSLRRGLVSMVPNLIPVVAVLGLMGWLGIPLDSTTMMVGAMVIGIAVDDTIHFMHKFQGYFEEMGDLEAAVGETLRTTGSALLFTSLVLALGFSVFALGEMSNVRVFGLLLSFASVVAFLADLLVAPALLAVVERLRRRRRLPTAAVAPGAHS